VYLIFKLLNVSKTGRLSEDEFSSIYDVISLKWKVANFYTALFVIICYGYCVIFVIHSFCWSSL